MMSTYIYTPVVTLPIESLANIDTRNEYINLDNMKEHLEIEFENGSHPFLVNHNRVSDYDNINIINKLELPLYYWNLDNEGGHPEFKYGDVIFVIFASGIQRIVVTNIR